MSYRIPRTGQRVLVVGLDNDTQEDFVDAVIDVSAGVVTVSKLKVDLRYVDPAGATAFECMTWHYPDDDTSRIGQIVPPSEPQNVPEYAKRIVKRRTGG